MFCKFCGKQLKDDARFCSTCGNPCEEAPRQEPPGREQPGQMLVKRPPVTPASDLLGQLQQAHAVCCRSNVYLEKAAELENEAVALGLQSKKRMRNFLIAFGVFFLIGNVIALLLFLIALPFVLVARKKRAKQVDELRQEAARKQLAAQDIFEQNYALISFLPSDYWYPMATDYLVKMVLSKRAADLPAALDLYDMQLHRWKVEEANVQIIQQQQMQTAHLKGIRTSSAVNAAASVANVAFNIARHL